jgi:hypothetical protein
MVKHCFRLRRCPNLQLLCVARIPVKGDTGCPPALPISERTQRCLVSSLLYRKSGITRGISHADGVSTLGQLNQLANPSPILSLGGSTTHLRLFWLLNGISYPTLWKRLLSAGVLCHASLVIYLIQIRSTRDNSPWPVCDA